MGESYFGGERGRGAAGKVAVFGVLERAGKAYTVAVPDYEKETLVAEIAAAAVKGGASYTDEFGSYRDLEQFGKHVPVNHRETFGVGRAHINGIEGFWSFAKRLYRLRHGGTGTTSRSTRPGTSSGTITARSRPRTSRSRY